MSGMTPEKEKGTQFEIWLSLLLKAQGHYMVQRNMCYHKNLNTFREVDISYYLLNEAGLRRGKLSHVLVEAKYLTEGPLKYALRSTKKKRGQLTKTIDNLIVEVLERQAFVGGDYTILATNTTFEKKLLEEAKKTKIILLDKKDLQREYNTIGYKGNIEDSIRRINVEAYMNYRSHIYL